MMQIHGLKRLHVNVSLCQAYRGIFYVFFFSFLLYIKRTRIERKIVHSMYGVGVINRLYIIEESKIRYNRSVMMKTKQHLSQLVLFTVRLRMVVATLEKSDPQTGRNLSSGRKESVSVQSGFSASRKAGKWIFVSDRIFV